MYHVHDDLRGRWQQIREFEEGRPPCCAVDRSGGRQGENLIANEGRVVGRDRGANLMKTKTMTVTQTVAPPGLRKNGLRK